MVPNNTPKPEREHAYQNMVPLRLREGVTFVQTLFVGHRDVFLAKNSPLKVTRLVKDRSDHLCRFVQPLGEGMANDIVSDCNDAMKLNDMELKDNPASVGFEVKLMGEMIGLVVVNRRFIGNDDINWLRSNFEIESLVNLIGIVPRLRAMSHNFLSILLSLGSQGCTTGIMRVMVKTLLFFQPAQHGATPKEIIKKCARYFLAAEWNLSGESLPENAPVPV